MENVQIQIMGDGHVEARADSVEAPADAGQAGVPPTPGGWHIIVEEVHRVWNINEEEIPRKIAALLRRFRESGYVTLYVHTTWGHCRVTKFIVLSENGNFLDDGKWVDNSSHRNVHKYKVMRREEFLAKYAGKRLVAYAYVSPSCNQAKQFSFRVVFRVVVGGQEL